MSLIKESEKKYIISDTTSAFTGTRIIQLRHDTPFSIKKRIVDRLNKENLHATLYSDNHISSLPSGTASMERTK